MATTCLTTSSKHLALRGPGSPGRHSHNMPDARQLRALLQTSHLGKVRTAVEQGLYDPESPGVSLTQQAEALQNGGLLHHGALTPPRNGQDSNTDSSPSPSKPNLGPGLSMMAQMAAGGLRSPGGPESHLPDSRSMLMPQFYGMNSYPIGVTNTVHNV